MTQKKAIAKIGIAKTKSVIRHYSEKASEAEHGIFNPCPQLASKADDVPR